MSASLTRRGLLRASGATFSAVLVSGCMDIVDSSDDTSTATPAPVPSPDKSPVPANTVLVGPESGYGFEPEVLQIETGTTVTWVWESGVHNLVVDKQPDEASWKGHEPLEDDGFNYEHTFSVTGRYEYRCDSHDQFEARGAIIAE